MAGENTAARRVENALKVLRRGLAPFVAAQMRAKHGDGWESLASRAKGAAPNGPLDAYALLKTLLGNWRSAFEEAFGSRERFVVRNFVSTALDARNVTAHLAEPLKDAEALRYLDAIAALLRAVEAPGPEVAEAEKLYEEQRREGLPPTQSSPAPPPRPASSVLHRPSPTDADRSRLESSEAAPVSLGRLHLWAARPSSNVHRIISAAVDTLPATRKRLVAELQSRGISSNPYGAIGSLMTNAGNAYGTVFVEQGGFFIFTQRSQTKLQRTSGRGANQ